MTWKPTIAARARTPCWPWDDWRNEQCPGHPIGAQCVDCGMDVALNPALIAYDPVCIYDAFRTGLLPLIIREPGDERSLHQLAVEIGATPPLAAKPTKRKGRKGRPTT